VDGALKLGSGIHVVSIVEGILPVLIVMPTKLRN
jgi:hypothetical protein